VTSTATTTTTTTNNNNNNNNNWLNLTSLGPPARPLLAAELAASRKEEKYDIIGSQYLSSPIAVETLGPLNTSA